VPELIINDFGAGTRGTGSAAWIEVVGGVGYGPMLVAQSVTSTVTSTIPASTGNANTIINMAGNMAQDIDTWREWNSIYTLSWGGTGAAITEHNGWPFTTQYTTSGVANTFAWNIWCDKYDRIRAAGTRAAEIQRYSRRKLTEEELLAALEQEKKAREEAEKRAAAARLAEKRAEDLLSLCLSPQQREDLEKKKCFYVEIAGKAGKKERYRIDRGSHGNVKQIDERGSIIRQFCIQPSGVPAGDILLTQKLWLEASDETRDEFWATANITTLMREKEVPAAVPRKERRRYAEAHNLLH